jgi:hypothetical protein
VAPIRLTSGSARRMTLFMAVGGGCEQVGKHRPGQREALDEQGDRSPGAEGEDGVAPSPCCEPRGAAAPPVQVCVTLGMADHAQLLGHRFFLWAGCRAWGSLRCVTMREFLGRSGGRGVTVTMIANLLAREQLGVARRTVRRWPAEYINRGGVERSAPGFYRPRRRADTRDQHRGRRSRSAYPSTPGRPGLAEVPGKRPRWPSGSAERVRGLRRWASRCPAGRPPCLGAAVAAVRRPVSGFPVWGCFAVVTFGAASLGRLGECMRMVLCGQPTMPGADQRAAHG